MEQEIKTRIRKIITAPYYTLKKKKWKEGDYINYSGAVLDTNEMMNLIDVALRQWFTMGHYCDKFEQRLRLLLDVKHCILTNSGSSSNLLAITALTSPKLLDKRLRCGDEVITTACCFPTTVNPIIQNKLVPAFVDIDINTFGMKISQIESMINPRTKAIFLTHAFGNPVDMDAIMDIAHKHNLWVIEDNCDALGSKWNGKCTGTIGDIGTLSFYPAHHITTGEGGAVITNNDHLKRILQSFRDWGRDCWCKPGDISKCDSRFSFQFGELPYGYDHKYVYTHIGYNLKMNDMNAAIGVAQMDKLYDFKKKRKRNFSMLYDCMKNFEKVILPKWLPKSEPSWFAFPFTYRKRSELIKFLEKNKIQTRLIFAGNILKQPAYQNIYRRSHKNLCNTETVMNESMFLGVYPGITIPMMRYITDKLKEFFDEN